MTAYTSARGLRAIVDARIAGLQETFVSALAEHLANILSDARRAIPLAQAVQALGGSSALLREALRTGATIETLIRDATQLTSPTHRLGITGERALRTRLGNGG